MEWKLTHFVRHCEVCDVIFCTDDAIPIKNFPYVERL